MASVIYLWLMLRHERITGNTESEECSSSYLESRTRHEASFLMQNIRAVLGTHTAFLPEGYFWPDPSQVIFHKARQINQGFNFFLDLNGLLIREHVPMKKNCVFKIIQAQGFVLDVTAKKKWFYLHFKINSKCCCIFSAAGQAFLYTFLNKLFRGDVSWFQILF